MAIQLFGNPFNLQGGGANLQGGYNPQQTVNPQQPAPLVQVQAVPTPVRVAPKPVAPRPVARPAPVYVAPRPVPVPQLNTAGLVGAGYDQYVGARASAQNPGVAEYYRTDNGQALSQNDLVSYIQPYAPHASSGNIFDVLKQGYQPQVSTQVEQYQPVVDPNQSLAESAGLGGLGFDEYQKILNSQNAVSYDEQNQIKSGLGIPALEQSIFAPPAKTTAQLYNDAYSTAGLGNLKSQIDAKIGEVNSIQQKYTDKAGTINENPFLSEASRVGRQRILTEQQEADIGNRINELNSLKDLYNSGLEEVGGLVTRQTADYSANQTLAQNHLTYLQKQAEDRINAAQGEKSATAYKYLPDYLKAKAQAAKPDTIELNDGSLVSYDKSTGTFVTVRGPIPKEIDPLDNAKKLLEIQKLQQELSGSGVNDLDRRYKEAQIQKLQQDIATPKPPTDAQNQSASYALRVKQSGDIIKNLESAIQTYSPTGFAAQMKLPSFAQSGNVQSYNQAAKNFINSVLRRESGAAIAQSEFDNAYAQYLPKPGDTAQNLEQKRQNRDAVLRGLIQSSGSAYGQITGSNNNLGGSVSDPLGLFGEKGGGTKAAAANQKFPDGTVGGQCGTFAHKLVDFPPVGNYLAQKQAVVNKSGVSAAQWRKEGARVGDVIISNYGVYGHVEVVVGTKPDGSIITKGSNLGLDEKISTRTISPNDSRIYGVLRGKLKV